MNRDPGVLPDPENWPVTGGEVQVEKIIGYKKLILMVERKTVT